MPNPEENNNPAQNKQKQGKEFAQENETPKREGVNLESNYKSKGDKPVSVNFESNTDSRAIGHNTTKNTSSMSGDLSGKHSGHSGSGSGMGGGLSEDPKLTHSNQSNNNSSGGLSGEPKDYVPKTPEGNAPKVKIAPPSKSTDTPKETAESGTPKEKIPSKAELKASGDPEKKAPEKDKKEKKRPVLKGELKEFLDVVGSKEPKEKISTESSSEEENKSVKEAKDKIDATNNVDSNPTNTTETPTTPGSTGGAPAKENKEPGKENETEKDANAQALAAFAVEETDDEKAANTEEEKIANEGRNHGLIVGRSMGYGAKLSPVEDGTFDIAKFSDSDDPGEEQAAKNKYNEDNDKIAKNMEAFGSGEEPENGEGTPKKGYYNSFITGYNEGHREGSALKAEAAAAERTAEMNKEQDSDEYRAGVSLGALCGTLTAQGKTEVDTKFSMKKDGEIVDVIVKTTVAELDSAAFDKKQTPGGELSGPAYEKAFLLHYNLGYREGQKQRSQPPPMDDDYKLGYEKGYKLGNKRGKGEEGDEDLVALETTLDAKDQQALKKEELQEYRGFYAGYNKGYAQVAAAKKNKAKKEREEKNNDPNFKAGYSAGNLKGFLTAMIEPSGIELSVALKSTQKMEEAGVPDYFPIPDDLRATILADLTHGDVAENDSEKDSTKALLGKPLFKEGNLFGYNNGYRQGQNSRAAFKRDKHKMHPDYQKSVLVLMVDSDSPYKGPLDDGEGIKFENGFTIGQILANAQFEFNELTRKKTASEKDEKRIKDLSTAIAGLDAFIGKESSYYKSGVDEFYNWWMGELAKKAQKKKVEEGYEGAEGSNQNDGFKWGMLVGAKVVDGKEKLKEINRKGRDIKARSTELNKAIKNSETTAKKESGKRGGEDYYIGYRNGYNHAFRVAKAGKKSDMGNQDTGDLLKDAGGGKSNVKVDEIIKKVFPDTDLGITDSKFKAAIKAIKAESKSKRDKAFKDGLSRGYSSGYSATVIDVKTGEPAGGVKSDPEQIKAQYKTYKGEKEKDEKATDSESLALQLLYFFLVGYQYHNKDNEDIKYGLPKGIGDAKSFNLGYQKAIGEFAAPNEKATKSEGNPKTSGSGMGLGDPKQNAKSNDVGVSSDAHKAGYAAAKAQAQYNAFKKGMIKSSTRTTEGSNEKENVSSEKGSTGGDQNVAIPTLKKGEVDDSLTNGFQALADAETVNVTHQEDKSTNKHHVEGHKAATNLWTKILFMVKGIELKGVKVPNEVIVRRFEGGNEIKETLETDSVEMASKYYNDQDHYIEKIANAYIKSMTNVGSMQETDASKEKADKEEYIAGYKAKIAIIEAAYKDQTRDNWLYDYGYYLGVKDLAPDAPIHQPEVPYVGITTESIDKNNTYFKKGHLDGVKMGNRIKTGLVDPSDANLAEAGGDEYHKGFEEGGKEGGDAGVVGLIYSLNEELTRTHILGKIKQNNNQQDSGVDFYEMSDDYREGYLEAYLISYRESRDYTYGRVLGYKRGAEGGDAMFNTEPEGGVFIYDNNTFFLGFDYGRNRAASGLPEEEGKEDEKATIDDSPYETNYAGVLKDSSGKELDQVQKDGTGNTDLEEGGKNILEVLKDLLFSGTKDFYLDELFLIKMFNALETKVDGIRYYIKPDLEAIESNRSLSEASSEDDYKFDNKEQARLEKELEKENLPKKRKEVLNRKLATVKERIADRRAKSDQVNEEWQAAEAAAKEKIDSIRVFMKDSLAFDTPLESNEDILNYIKVNLESSKGNKKDIYEDIDIFNDLVLSGAFNYKESNSVDVSILGNADFYIDSHAEHLQIENAAVLMKENGFEFKARGLSYIQNDKELIFKRGSIVTPSIEGGENVGEKYLYSFDDFSIHLGQGVKSQIDNQKYKLEGGSS